SRRRSRPPPRGRSRSCAGPGPSRRCGRAPWCPTRRRGGARDGPDRREPLLEAPGGVGEGEAAGDDGRASREHGEAHAQLAEGRRHARGGPGDPLVEARELPHEVGHLRRREVPRGDDEAEADVVERHVRLPSSACLLDLAGLALPLLPDALEQPVPVDGGEVEGLGERGAEPRAAVLSPAQLEEALAPAVEAHPREELLRSRRLAVLAFPGRKNPRSKGSSTSWTVKHSGHSTSMAVSTPQSTRSNSSTRKSASRRLRSSRKRRLSFSGTPSTSSTRQPSIAERMRSPA